MRIDKGHFGLLHIPMIQDKFPEDIDILISQRVGKGPSTKCDHFMRVCTDKNEENEKFLALKMSI